MNIFQGIDLNSKYVKPSTLEWLAEQDGDFDACLEAHVYDDGYGVLVWTYSADLEDERIPSDLMLILREAYNRGWRFITLDSDGDDCVLFKSYEEEWRNA